MKTGDSLIIKNADASIVVLKNVMTQAGDLNYEEGYLNVGFILARVYKNKGLFFDALKTVEYLHKYAEEHQNKLLKGKCYCILGEINRAAFDGQKALVNLFEAISIFKELENIDQLSKGYNRLSAVYFELKMMDLAEQYADSSIQFARSLANHNLVSSNKELMGAIYCRTNRQKEAIANLRVCFICRFT